MSVDTHIELLYQRDGGKAGKACMYLAVMVRCLMKWRCSTEKVTDGLW
jgi:hypothetical protein